MTRAKIRKFVSAVLSAAMCCVAGGAVTPVYAVQYNHVVMEEIPGGGYKFELQNPQDGVIYGLFQIFSGEFGHDDTTGQPVFLDDTDYVYGESHPDAGQPVSDEAKQQYLNDNSGYLDSIMNQLKPIAILSVENPTYECGEGVYLWARAASDSTGGDTGGTGGSETGGDGTGSGSVDIIWTDIEDAVVTNPSISGEKVDGVYSLTVEKPAAGHRYKVYQIYTGDVNGNGRNLSNVKYGSNYGETGSAVPSSKLDGIEDAKEFARKIVSEGTVHGEPVAVLTEDSPTQELPAGYYLVIDESDGDMENDAISDFVVAIVGTTKFTPKSTSVPKFDKTITDKKVGMDDLENMLVIPNGTIEIGDFEYRNKTDITSVFIPKSVTSIGIQAFKGCTNLQKVIFEESSQLTTINDGAFAETSLESITLPENVTYIGSIHSEAYLDSETGGYIYDVGSPFRNCSNLKYINLGNAKGLTYIPRFFLAGTQVEHMVIPSNITTMNTHFAFCNESLKSVYIPSSVETIWSTVFHDANPSVKIYCEINENEMPSGWDSDGYHWNDWMNFNQLETVWGVTLDEYKNTVGYVEQPNEEIRYVSEYVDTTVNFGIGDSVPFNLVASIPQSISAYDKYKLTFHDTLSDGLTYDEGSMKVFVGDAEVDSSAYTVIFNGQQFTVEIADAKAEPFNAVPGSRIYVRYSATLNDSAAFRNINNAYLEYSNNPNGEGTGTTVSDDVTAFTFTVDIDKVDKDGNELAGAGFTLYKKTEDGYVQFGDEITGGTNFSFSGLAVGDYKFVESTTPDGYNTMEDLEFSVVADSTEDAAGNAKVTELKIVAQGGTLDSDMIEGWTVNDENSILSADINNYKGSELPSTGGMGTMMFYVVGGCIMAVVCFILVKRKEQCAK